MLKPASAQRSRFDIGPPPALLQTVANLPAREPTAPKAEGRAYCLAVPEPEPHPEPCTSRSSCG
jgi:hypothetical protein